jgi:hypothetical protein
MRKSPLACRLLAIGMVAGFSLNSASAQNLCSGACRWNRVYLQTTCQLSAFQHFYCVDFSSGCADYACPSSAPGAPSSISSEASPTATALQTTAAIQELPAPRGQVLVVKLKARS